MADKIEFFWDAISPYTYIAATQMDQLAADTGCEVQWRPFFLAGVMKATDNKPPLTVPAKGSHMLTDLKRWAKLYDVPFKFPKPFPVNTIYAMRAAMAADQLGQGPTFGLKLMTDYFSGTSDITQPEALAAAATHCGLDPNEVSEAMQSQAIKDALNANTEEAVSRGAFGAPTFFVGSAMYWGNDRIDMVKAFLTADR